MVRPDDFQMLIGQIEVPTLEELLISKIEQQIFSGRLKPGDKLPSERQLQEETKISRSVVHAGLVKLEKDGFIEIRPRCGAFVTDYTVTGTLDALYARIRHNGGVMTQSQINAFFEMRIAIEGIALRKIAESHTDEAIAELEALIGEINEIVTSPDPDREALALCMFRFQRSLCLHCGNEFFPLFMNEFKPIILQFWEESINLFGPAKTAKLAVKYLGDIKNHDPESAYQRLVRSSENYICRRG